MSPTKSRTTRRSQPVEEEEPFVFDAPEDYGSDVGSALNEGIQLPFFAPFLSFNNGAAAWKKTSLPAYTGAWSMFVEDMDALNAEIGHPHQNFELVEGLSGKGGEYDAWMAQHVYVSLLGQRTRWLTGDNGKVRSHMQALVALAEDPGGTDSPEFYSFAVLVAKGYQTDNLKRAFSSWFQQSMALRKQAAGAGRPPLHESLFWVPVGRFGKERHVEAKGTGRNQSDVAPIVSMFQDLKAKGAFDYMRMMYVGRENAEMFRDAVLQSREWLNDKIWKDGRDQPVQQDAAGNVPEVPPDDFEEDEEPPWMKG